MKNKTSLIVSAALLSVFIVSVASVQVKKINTERDFKQQAIDIQKQELAWKKEQELKKVADKAYADMMIGYCIEDAEDAYWDFMELNGTGKRNDEKGVTAATRFWDDADKAKEKDIDNCYRKYQL